MGSRTAEAGDYLARACFPKPKINAALEVKYKENGRPIVYCRRWLVLTAYCLGYFMWNVHTYRQTPLISEYALYFDRTNDVQLPPEYGIDFMLAADNFYLLFFYPLAGKLIDTYGLNIMILGSIGQALSTWWWFLSFESFASMLLSRILASISGAMVATALLRISNNWFSQSQRALAVAVGSIVATFGSGAALFVGPLFFSDGISVINFDLKSCKESFKETFNLTGDVTGLACSNAAGDAFCCVTETDIDGLNFWLAVVMSVIAVFTVLAVKDSPPTPPSKAGIIVKGPSMRKAMTLMFMHKNYNWLCLADFLSSGPPLVLFSTIDRIFPQSVSDQSTTVAAVALILSIPAAGIFSYVLAKTRKYYEMTAAGYSLGFLAWFLATVCVFVGTQAANVSFLIIGGIAIICLILWTVSVYELKMEYVFSAVFALQGYVVAVDRTVINLSSLVFLVAIPPERIESGILEGRLFTFTIGSISMLLGTLCVYAIRKKRKYLREEFETEKRMSVAEIQDKNEFFAVDEKVQAEAAESKEKDNVEANVIVEIEEKEASTEPPKKDVSV